ncbi:MAG TPA: C13 family peptidase [Steroidobacteraceae bacterium]|nr:C13 family peptidase [Steroidobacteraceae bacterium]
MDDNEPLNQPPDPAATATAAGAATATTAETAATAATAAKPERFSLSLLLQLWTLRKWIPNFSASNFVLITLSLVWLTLWVAIDWWQALPDPQFLLAGVPLFAWYALAILALAALLRGQSKPMPPFSAALLLSLGMVPLPLLLAAVALPFLNLDWRLAAVAVLIHSSFYLARGLRAFTGESQRRATLTGIVFLMAFIWLTDALDVIPDVWAAPEVAEAADGGDSQVDAETVLFEQPRRIDQALAAIRSEDSPSPKAFFLGFAGVGEQKVFAQEIGLASRVLSERYGMENRALSLINDQRDLERAPVASVSGLKYALRGLAGRMNLDRDVLFLVISSHGAREPAIAVSNSDLPLNDMTDEDLAGALSDSGIKWRVIIISACYAGGFIDALRNPRTIVITAAAADRTSFGCSNDRDLTYFGEAFFRDALPEARSLRDAFERAKSAIALRERREHVDASKPQAYFGAELETKLAAMKDHAPQ